MMPRRKSMILDALQSRERQLSRAPKIIQIDLQILAGDDFQEIFLQSIDEISLVLLTFH